MSGSNVPQPEFTTAGVALPAESDIVAGFWADFQAAFGGALNDSPATPQGQLVVALAATLAASNDLFLQYVNQVDPAYADGRMQDAIARIYYLARIGSQPTTVACTCTGAAGTVIPAGSLAKATDGTIYQAVNGDTIPTGGSVSITFTAIDNGAIACPAGSMNSIYRVIPGWDSITNPADGTIGRDAETRTEFEARRAASVASNAAGMLPAIRGAVLNVAGVVDAYVTENSTGSSVTIGGVSVAANSLYVAVYGGADADVAQAIWSKKSPGCGMVGSTSITVTDSNGYSLPYPSYTVKFQRASALPIYFAVSIASSADVPADAAALIQGAITAAFNGDDGGAPARIGSTVYALRFATAIAALGSWARIISIAIGTTSTPTSASVAANINQIPTTDAAHIAVTVV